MFETLFTYPSVLRRHRIGPLATERAAYLSELADRGMAHGTILRWSSYCLCIAIALQRWPPDRCFDKAEVELLAEQWAAQRAGAGRASSPRWPKAHFRFSATDFLLLCCRQHNMRENLTYGLMWQGVEIRSNDPGATP
jgi:hypothetical protein